MKAQFCPAVSPNTPLPASLCSCCLNRNSFTFTAFSRWCSNLPLASPCQLLMQPCAHLRAYFLGQHSEVKCFPYLFSLCFHPSFSCSLPWPLFYILSTLCWSLTAKPSWYLLLVLGPLYRSTPVSQESELQSTCTCFMMKEGNRAYHFLCHLHLPLFCFLGRSRSAMLCQKSLVSQSRSPKQLKDFPRAMSMGLVLLPGNASGVLSSRHPELQFKMSLRNVLCLQTEGGRWCLPAVGLLWKAVLSTVKPPCPLQRCRSIQELPHQREKCSTMRSCPPCHVPA